MPIEVQTRSGSCPTHGAVEGTREVPGSGFPFVVNAVRRYMARKKPYRCPTCGAPVTTN